MHTIQMHLSQKQNIFSEFSAAFFKSALNFEHFQKKMSLIAYVFPKLTTTKNVLENENVRNLMQIRKMQRKSEKKSFVFCINASELWAFNCLY